MEDMKKPFFLPSLSVVGPFVIGSFIIGFSLTLAGCSQAAAPRDNGLWREGGEPIATRAVRIGTEGPTLPACPSVSRVRKNGTNVYWAPGEERVIKARLAGGVRVALCDASDDDAWFAVVFAAPRGRVLARCAVARPVASIREYQGPCRWGWIKGGSVEPDG